MTRDWKSLLRESKGLLVAIFISLFLHLFILGQSYLVLPQFGENHYPISARLITPKPEKIVEPKKEIVQHNEPEPAPPLPVPDELAKIPKEAPEAPEVPETASPAPQSVAEPPPQQIEAEHNTDQVQPLPEVLPDDSGLIDKPKPYQYVETYFDVRTDTKAKVDSSPAGRAKIVYNLIRSGEGYEISSLIQAQGLVALVIPDLLQTSKGYLSEQGLKPMDYLYQFGDKKDKTYTAKFDWETSKLNMHSIKGDKQAPLIEGAQDLLSFMYQFMFVPPLQNMQLAITNGKKLDIYDYSFEGEEVIQTKMGDIKTVHLLRTSEDDEKDELWLALDYQYVPVKIRKTEKENKVYELLATSIKTEKPPI